MSDYQPTVLIVDDDADDLAAVERALRSLACELVAIKDPHGVLPSVQRLQPAVVILDALLPGLSGFDLCKQIKTDPQLKGTQVLILTGVYLRQQYRQEALQQFKADGFLTKPFRPPELQRLVVQFLAKRTRSPQSAFLKRSGHPAAEPRKAKKRGFLDRIFGKSEADDAPTRIAPREGPPTAVAEPAITIAASQPDAPADPPMETSAALAPEPVAEAAPEPVAEAAPEPVAETPPEPVAETPPEPVAETPPEPVAEAPPEPVAEAAPEPVAEAAPEPVVEPAPEPVAEPAPEPVAEPAPEPVAESEPEGESPALAEAASEPVQAAAAPRETSLDELDARPVVAPEPVTWVEALSKTRELRADEIPLEAREQATVPMEALALPAPEPIAATPLEPVEGVSDEGPSTSPALSKRPKAHVGDVPVYEEEDFVTELKRELSKCKRVDRPLTLILIRVSDLRQIVELFGSDVREPVLWHVAEQAMAALREVDLVGMISSKGFVAMTAFASDRYGGGRIVSRMRQGIKKKPFPVGEELPPIIPALQFGMATFPQDGSDVTGLMSAAEKELAFD